jgi:hypothetical protein
VCDNHVQSVANLVNCCDPGRYAPRALNPSYTMYAGQKMAFGKIAHMVPRVQQLGQLRELSLAHRLLVLRLRAERAAAEQPHWALT